MQRPDVIERKEGPRRNLSSSNAVLATANENSPFRKFQTGNSNNRRSYTWPIGQEFFGSNITGRRRSHETLLINNFIMTDSNAQTDALTNNDQIQTCHEGENNPESISDETSTRLAVFEVGNDDQRGSLAVDSDGDMTGGAGRLRRQVTFIVAAVQTDFPNWEAAGLANVANSQQAANATTVTRTTAAVGRCRGQWWPHWCCIDCTSAFYVAIALLMLSVGVTIIVITSLEHWNGTEEKGNNIAAAQLWVIGPIFLCSGSLVCVKLVTRIYRLIRGRRDNSGNFLESDSRRSLAALPPSYSRALNARIPSNVLIETEIKPEDAVENAEGGTQGGDTDSMRLVTITCDPPPPSYTEAIVMLKNEIVDRRNKEMRDVGVQSNWSASTETIVRSRLASVTSRPSDILEPRPSISGNLNIHS